MKDFTVYHRLEELNSFVGKLKNESFEEFSFEDVSKWDGDYVLFSFIPNDNLKKVSKLIKVMDKIPLPYIINPYMDHTIFTVLCFVLKHNLTEVKIYGHCHIKVVSNPPGIHGNTVVVSNSTYTADRIDLSFFPDLNSFNEVFKSIKSSDFNNIEFNVGSLSILDSNTIKWSLKELLNRFKFISLK